MSRADDVAFVAAVYLWLRYGLIDQAAALVLLTAYRDGTIGPVDLPAPEAAIIHPPTPAEIEGASTGLKSFIAKVLGKGKAMPPPALGTNTALRNLSTRVRADFAQTTKELAANVSRGEMSVAEWESAFADHVAAHLLNQHMIGTGSTDIAPEAMQRLADEVVKQRAYASRFADQMSLAKAEGTPMSEAAIAARSAQYGGAGYAEYWRASEQTIAAASDMAGWVSEYRALDDGSTCAECANADTAGPYLLNDGPWPGDVCRGRGHCRCERVIVYDPQAYAKLQG